MGKKMKISTIVLLSALLAFIIGILSIKILHKEDNPIEEACEKIIKSTTQIDVDLSPGSKEQ